MSKTWMFDPEVESQIPEFRNLGRIISICLVLEKLKGKSGSLLLSHSVFF